MIFGIEVISLVSESTSVWIEISFLVITVLETVVWRNAIQEVSFLSIIKKKIIYFIYSEQKKSMQLNIMRR